MARPPRSEEELVERYGPHLNEAPPGGWNAGLGEIDRAVPTHCCFCGQQCGIILKVRDEQVVGFDYGSGDGGNYQDTCPGCRRAQVTLAQSARVGGFG